MHNLLIRQIRKSFGADWQPPDDLRAFLSKIDETYRDFDRDHALLERSLEISSSELLEKNNEIRSLVAAMPDMLFRLDSVGRILDFRGTAEVGAPEIVRGNMFMETLPEPGASSFFNAMRKCIENKTMAVAEFHFDMPDGRNYYEAKITPFQGNQALALVRNISERQRSAWELANSSSLLRATLDSTADGILVVDRGNRITILNNKFLEMWGIDPLFAEARSDNLFIAFVEDQLINPAAFRSKIQSLYGRPEEDSYDRLEFKDGRVFERFSRPQRMGAEIVGRVWSFRDITANIRADRELHRQKDFYGQILENLDTDIAVFDLNLRYEYLNRSAIANADTREWLIGKDDMDCCVHRGRDTKVGQNRQACLRKAIEEKGVVEMEEEITVPDGIKKYYLRRYIPVFGANGDVLRIVGFGIDMTDRKMAEEQITYLAQHDWLTGLANRIALYETLSEIISRPGTAVALFFLDLDRLKDINDSLGHRVGDILLKEIADRLRLALPPGGTVARIGGDEFVIVAPGVETEEAAARVADTLVGSITSPVSVADREMFVTASIGIVLHSEKDGDITQLLGKADLAMYASKEHGRNTYRFYRSEMKAGSERKLSISTALRKALERDEMFLHYQPLYDVRSRLIIGAEALVRWRHPEFGMVGPDIFIPLAEESGLIHEIGAWVMRSACAYLAGLGIPDLKMAVNLSMMQFRKNNLSSLIDDILRDTGIAAAQLEVELTEGVIMENPTRDIPVLNLIHEMGVRISIDDFGTGYSSLSYLNRFPIHMLKIDRSFVSKMHESRNDEAITGAIIAMAHKLGLLVTAEGVENALQLEKLRVMKCDVVQGYHFSKPVSSHDFNKIVNAAGGCFTTGGPLTA